MKPLIINGILTQYSINENGIIFNNKTNKELTGTIRSGYKMVKLSINGAKKDYSVHRLVALAFLSNPDNLPQVNHIDKNKLNNCVSNLEWISSEGNCQHRSADLKIQRQDRVKINEDITESMGWKQYLDTAYWFNKDGRAVNKKTGYCLNPIQSANGYYRYCLYINQTKQMFQIHRLIYEVFSNTTIPKNYQINHINGNKADNSFNNLECITQQVNIQHSFQVLKKNIKKVYQYDLNGQLLKQYDSMSQASKENDFNISGISQACNGKIKTYKNYIWKTEE